MKWILGFLFVWSIGFSLVNAEDIHLKNGQVFRNVLVYAKTEDETKFWFNDEFMELQNYDILKIDSTKRYDKTQISYIGSIDPKIDAELFHELDGQTLPIPNNFMYFGYAGNIPNVPYGFTFGWVNNDKVGYYVSLKFGPNGVSDDQLYKDISRNKAENIYEDRKIGTKEQYFGFDLGITVRVYQTLFIFGGVGYSHLSEYINYQDKFEILGKNGSYYINGNESSSFNLNIGAGFILPNGWYLSIGGDTTPAGMELGIGMTL